MNKKLKIKGFHKKGIHAANACMTAVCVIIFFCLASCGKSDSVTPEPCEKNYSVTAEKEYKASDINDIIKSYTEGTGISESALSALSALIKGIKVVSITYSAPSPDGTIQKASGIIAYPVGINNFDRIYSIQHTTVELEDAPSLKLFSYEMLPAALGNVVVMADYIGYGASKRSDRQQPYLQVDLTGNACLYMLAAASEYLEDSGISFSSKDVVLAGYSQGGMATIATLMKLENSSLSSMFNIKAVHAGGGIYDIKTCLDNLKTSGKNYSQMQFIALMLRGIAYGENLNIDFGNVFTKELMSAGIINVMATQPFSTWNTLLGTDVSKVLNTDFLAYPLCNGNTDAQKMYNALMKNSLVNCTAPQTPFTLYHCKTDTYIPYENAVSAAAAWPNATLVTLDADGHMNGAVEFMLRVFGVWNLINKT